MLREILAHRVAAFTFAVVASGCGGTSTSPLVESAPLGDGTFVLGLSGDSFKCHDTTDPQVGTPGCRASSDEP
jgi:hypothetical protein